jgi:hypothetical protein
MPTSGGWRILQAYTWLELQQFTWAQLSEQLGWGVMKFLRGRFKRL